MKIGLNMEIFQLVLDAVHFVETYLQINSSEEKKQAAIGFVQYQINKLPGMSLTDLDDKFIDVSIELAVSFMNRVNKDKY